MWYHDNVTSMWRKNWFSSELWDYPENAINANTILPSRFPCRWSCTKRHRRSLPSRVCDLQEDPGARACRTCRANVPRRGGASRSDSERRLRRGSSPVRRTARSASQRQVRGSASAQEEREPVKGQVLGEGGRGRGAPGPPLWPENSEAAEGRVDNAEMGQAAHGAPAASNTRIGDRPACRTQTGLWSSAADVWPRVTA